MTKCGESFLKLLAERNKIVEYGKKMVTSGLTAGKGGNLSIFNRDESLVAVSPSGMDYFETRCEDIVLLLPDGEIAEGSRKPTSEVDLHLAIYRTRPDVGAVVHTHPVFATTLATLGWEIPPISYLIAGIGPKIPLARYETYGTPELAKSVTEYIRDFDAVLMANHGVVTVGENLESAFEKSETVEFMAQVYWRAKCVGNPMILPNDEIAKVRGKLSGYGQNN